jgi:hypothetical protein
MKVLKAKGSKAAALSLGQLRKSLFGISLGYFVKAGLAQSRFYGAEISAWQRLTPIAHAVMHGYHAALEDSRPEALAPRLYTIEAQWRGFAFEGAGMGLTLLDCLLPWKHRLQAFLAGSESTYTPLLYIGAGLALARLHRRPERLLPRLDPVLCWLVIDGYGFHEGFFVWQRYVKEKTVPLHLSGYARRVFDQGLGRSLWFSTGADADRILATIAAFPSSRHADLWTGVGSACAYAGGQDRAATETLHTAAGLYRPQLAQGAALAAMARQQAGNLATHTDLACEVLCGLSSDMAAHMAAAAMHNLPVDSREPAYDIWRQRIQAQLAAQAGETSRHLLNH